MGIDTILVFCVVIPLILAFFGLVTFAWFTGKPTKFAKWLKEN